MGADYRLNPAGFRAELLNAGFMLDEMRARADLGKAFAESIAPVDTGDYLASFSVDSGTNGGVHHDRAYAEVKNDSTHAGHVEWGNGRAAGQHVLTRAADVMR